MIFSTFIYFKTFDHNRLFKDCYMVINLLNKLFISANKKEELQK